MAHPFLKMFDKALKKSTASRNLVSEKAEELKEKGYRTEEIHEVLLKLRGSLIEDADREVVREALEEFAEKYMEEE